MKTLFKAHPILILFLVGTFTMVACEGKKPTRGRGAGGSEQATAALATYVAPGDLDEYYLFYSGGHSGQVFVSGIPSMRHIATIPVFTPYPGTGYGFDDETKAMLGGFTWGDVHHPSISETNGEYDGRWLFVNDNANNRVARIDLRDFKTKQILGPLPNVSGNHCSSFVTENTEYLTVASRFSVPIPKGTYAPVEDYATKYNGIVAGIAIDPEDGTMSLGWEILMPPFDYDLGDAGKGPSGEWSFWTSYNTEREYIEGGKLEVTASQKDKDYVIAVNWKNAAAAVKNGQYTMIGGAKVIDPAKTKGVVYFIPAAKSPHGVDVSPTGEYFVANGKLSPTVTVFSTAKMLEAIANEDFEKIVDGIPVLTYESVRVAEIPVGLGPLHTQYDGKGYAYTSLFIESAVVKWQLPPYDGNDFSQYVIEKIPVAYNIGHLATAEGDTRSPDGNYLVALNKLSKGRHISVGPSIPESAQLIDISGDKMKLLYDAFTEPEPHYAQIVKADKINTIEVYPKEESTDPNAIWDVKDASVTRKGRKVEVKMMAVRSFFAPDVIRVKKGDTVVIHITNIEQTRDELHGFAINEYNINVVVDPGETKTITFKAEKSGVFPFYCTNFCSALHQEMQGYLLVEP
jgi:nitrous-oxide reductase